MLTAATIPTLIDESKRAEMLVVGCRGRGALASLLLGSVSAGLVAHARCPRRGDPPMGAEAARFNDPAPL